MVKHSIRTALNRFAEATGWNLVRKPRVLWSHPDANLAITLDVALSHYRQQNPAPFCLQVGAFDGMAGDPIYPLVERHSLRGILVEPQIDAFERLRANYARFGDLFRMVNVAIAPGEGTKQLFRVRSGAGAEPEWVAQLASFDRGVVMKHAAEVPDIETRLIVEEVRCVTFDALLRDAGDPQVDFLQIDAEGYDAKILAMFDLRRRRPALVNFEHKHLDRKEHERSIEELVELGYKVAFTGENTLAYRMG